MYSNIWHIYIMRTYTDGHICTNSIYNKCGLLQYITLIKSQDVPLMQAQLSSDEEEQV